ncbi:uncharacterized protein N7518_006231 [Penicillium psychrosexuale]|uniref:uncharacterized protein n=1 Tax=Penicillium psychrosexuale TaxID=1002107 RepID=UPI00254506AC|nr:uncharacterized protein N7518_006231 [Penicillium psychrosexuale]KAJ5789220.1 hypothetical protein N7518_006231 [Penicillium psychrosexuale]
MKNEDDLRQDVESEENIISAAKICRIQHFVLDSMPDMRRATSGRSNKLFRMDHTSRWQSKTCLWSLASFLVPLPYDTERPCELQPSIIQGLFFANLDLPQY